MLNTIIGAVIFAVGMFCGAAITMPARRKEQND